jgi:hypothetical protein
MRMTRMTETARRRDGCKKTARVRKARKMTRGQPKGQPAIPADGKQMSGRGDRDAA